MNNDSVIFDNEALVPVAISLNTAIHGLHDTVLIMCSEDRKALL